MSPAYAIRNHEMFRHDPDRVDHHFHREDLMEVANLVPDEWMYDTSLAGSIDECVKKLQTYATRRRRDLLLRQHGCRERRADPGLARAQHRGGLRVKLAR